MKKGTFCKMIVGAALAIGLSGAAYADDVLAKVKAAGVMKVGTETEFAPFDYIDAGAHVGLNVDLFDEIGKELGVKIEWVTLPWDGVLPGLEAGKFDMVAGPATITKARMEHYRFTPPLAEATIALMKRKGDASIMKPQDIAGKIVGSAKATSQLQQMIKFADTLPTKAEVRGEYVGFNEAYADLAAGRIVAVGNSLPNIAFVAKQQPTKFEVVLPTFGAKTYFGFMGRKDPDYASLMDAVDKAMLKIKADGRMAKIQEKWFGTTFDTPDSVPTPNI
jgi:polar amino acid transport system substrate-binding protein